MKLEVTKTQSNGFVEVRTSHKDKSLTWVTPAYGKIRLENPNRIFEDINRYFDTLSAESLEVIWDAYTAIHSAMVCITDSYYVANTVRYEINKIYSVLKLEELKQWVMIHGGLHIPQDIQTQINSDSRYTDESQTYLRSDYINLAIFSVALRPMVPIWGAYLDLISDNQKGKELESMGLLRDTELMNWPYFNEVDPSAELPVTEKLTRYIDERIRDSSISMDSTWKGFGSAEIPRLILAKVIVRRLTIAIVNDPTTPSIIASVHWYIRYCLNPTARTTADRVADKKISTTSNSDDDEKNSFIDSHKIKAKVTTGDIRAYQFDAKSPEVLLEALDPTYDKAKLKKCLSCINVVKDMAINTHQKRLAQWVLGTVFPPKAYAHIDKMSIHYLIAATQAILWHWDFIDIAILLQVDRYSEEGIDGVILPIATKAYPRANLKHKEELNKAYPYMKQQRARPSDANPNERNTNIVAPAINNLTEDIRQGNWVYHGPKELWVQSTQPQGHNVIALPQNIKALLTDVVLHIANLKNRVK